MTHQKKKTRMKKLMCNFNWAVNEYRRLSDVDTTGLSKEQRKELKEARTHYYKIKQEFQKEIQQLEESR